MVTNRKAKALEFANEPYNITIIGRHVQVTEPMKDYAMKKIFKIEKFSNRIIDVFVTMDIQKIEHRIDIVMKVDHITIKVSATSNDMYASIDIAVAKLEEKIRRYKKRIQDHQAKSLKVIDMNVNVLKSSSDIDEVNDDIEEENQRKLEEGFRLHHIVKQETLPLKMLTHDEAIMKMELSGDAFLVFRSEHDKKIKVIYRRNDGNFGIIETE